MSKIDIFVSYDVDHDRELYDEFEKQARSAGSGYQISGASTRSPDPERCSDRVRRQIRDADQFVVICGEHTENCASVTAELAAAQEEGTAYLLLWGRRESMCQKPRGSKSSDGMFSWTQPILQGQFAAARRRKA